MVQRRLLKKEEDEELYDNISKVLSLSRREGRSSYWGLRQNNICLNISNLSNTMTFYQAKELLRGIDLDNFNTTSCATRHALGLIGRRSLDGNGNIKFIPHTNIELLSHIETGALLSSLRRLSNKGFTNIYTGYNSKHDRMLGACVDYKVPRYAITDGAHMKIHYAISLIEELSRIHLNLRSDIINYSMHSKTKSQRINYIREIENADRRYKTEIEKYAKIVDVAMQGMKKKMKIRALHNLCINANVEDWNEDYIMRARKWVQENPWNERDVEITQENINLFQKRIGDALSTIDCEVTIAKKIYDAKIVPQCPP